MTERPTIPDQGESIPVLLLVLLRNKLPRLNLTRESHPFLQSKPRCPVPVGKDLRVLRGGLLSTTKHSVSQKIRLSLDGLSTLVRGSRVPLVTPRDGAGLFETPRNPATLVPHHHRRKRNATEEPGSPGPWHEGTTWASLMWSVTGIGRRVF